MSFGVDFTQETIFPLDLVTYLILDGNGVSSPDFDLDNFPNLNFLFADSRFGFNPQIILPDNDELGKFISPFNVGSNTDFQVEVIFDSPLAQFKSNLDFHFTIAIGFLVNESLTDTIDFIFIRYTRDYVAGSGFINKNLFEIGKRDSSGETIFISEEKESSVDFLLSENSLLLKYEKGIIYNFLNCVYNINYDNNIEHNGHIIVFGDLKVDGMSIPFIQTINGKIVSSDTANTRKERYTQIGPQIYEPPPYSDQYFSLPITELERNKVVTKIAPKIWKANIDYLVDNSKYSIPNVQLSKDSIITIGQNHLPNKNLIRVRYVYDGKL